jgi:glycosyltransferase involved in cell wall biosynthesis
VKQQNTITPDSIATPSPPLISGFSFARNTCKLSYPFIESIRSILPVCDEFVVAVGRGDDDDTTRRQIEDIGDAKLRIIDTEWKDLETLRSRIYSQQTNIALDACRGTWCFYLQSDEVVHERYLATIREACAYFSDSKEVDGFLFRYKHFWGDYRHFIISHKWYSREIRIIRNHRNIVSVGDAQSFRYTTGGKVPAVELDAEVFHYGHVRDPRITHVRKQAMRYIYRGERPSAEPPPVFNYGSLEGLARYTGTDPAVMTETCAAMNWKHLLHYYGKSTVRLPHDRLKYRLLTIIEQRILGGSGREFWGYKPYRMLRRRSREFAQLQRSPAEPVGKAPSAAVIIAVYNHADFLEKVFLSLKNQTVQDFEIVIADDGSGPEIPAMIDRHRKDFIHPVQHVWHEDNGFRKTIIVNRAVLAARAPYCIFIDGDSLLHHRFVEYHLKRKRFGTVLAGRRVMMNRELSEKVTLDDIISRRIEERSFWWGKCNRAGVKHGFFVPGAFYIKNLKKRKSHDIVGANFSVHKEDFLCINGYDERIIGRGLEDDNLSVRFSMAGIPVKTMAHEALQYHLWHHSDPIPHSSEFKEQFRNNPESAWAWHGAVKKNVNAPSGVGFSVHTSGKQSP